MLLIARGEGSLMKDSGIVVLHVKLGCATQTPKRMMLLFPEMDGIKLFREKDTVVTL